MLRVGVLLVRVLRVRVLEDRVLEDRDTQSISTHNENTKNRNTQNMSTLRESYTQRKLYSEKAIHRILLLENTHRAGAYARETRGASDAWIPAGPLPSTLRTSPPEGRGDGLSASLRSQFLRPCPAGCGRS